MTSIRSNLPRDTPDLLILKVVARGPAHGYAIARPADTYCRRGAAWLALDKLAEADADFTRRRALGGTQNPDAENLILEKEGRRRPR